MRRPEWRALWPAWFGAASLLLCLALESVGARTSAFAEREPGFRVSADVLERPVSPSMHEAPCASCCVAPAPVVHGFNGETKEAAPSHWPAHAEAARPRQWLFALKGLAERVPVRIAFCRWLD